VRAIPSSAGRAVFSCLSFNSEDSPLVSKTWVEKIANKYGKASNIYKVRVRGEFPSSEPDVLIDISSVEAAIMREVPAEGEIQIGVDPARFGNNESVICYVMGEYVYPMKAFQGMDTVRLAGEVAALAKQLRRKHGLDYRIKVKIDETGVGAGVVDNLVHNEDEIGIKVMPINFGGSCSSEEEDDYYNLSAEMWGFTKKKLATCQLPDDEDMLAQLTTRKYVLTNNGKIRMESKEGMTKRGLVSPDRADALVLCLYEPQDTEIVLEEFASNELSYLVDVER